MASDLLTKLRAEMKSRGIDCLYVPTADPHQSEYVAAHFQTRVFLTGFTGSQGTAIVTQNEALLWTDGRYFIQAAKQIENTGFTLMKQSTPGYPSITEWLAAHLQDNEVLVFNGTLLSEAQYDTLQQTFAKRHVHLRSDETILEQFWTDRPAMPCESVFIHPLEFAGLTVTEKLGRLREKLQDVHAGVYASLENIAWLFNYRGRDIPNNPVAFAYAIVSAERATLYLDAEKYDDAFAAAMAESGVILKPYTEIFTDARNLKGKIAVDKTRTSHALFEAMHDAEIVAVSEAIYALKAPLNEVEETNTREAWLKDTVALVRYFMWLEDNVPTGKVDEYTAEAALLAFRERGAHFLEPSFDTISAYLGNGAMMHYRAEPATAAKLEPKGLYLVDSGGQYLDGTTDITRTVSLGEPTEGERRDYTLVLKAHLNLASAIFLYGVTGHYLDILARYPLWQHHIDYKSGTGHAVGYVSGVHEGPHRIGPVPNQIKLEPGMVVTNEPGIYREGVYGIRLENVYIIKDSETVGTDRFLKFDCLSFAPYDRNLIDVSLLSDHELGWLNDYHAAVYEKLSDRLETHERAWLERATAPLTR